jgi:hypothetical protein
MDKRLQKRHKRQVTRAKERVRLSEPDVRTPEQLKEAQEASRPAGGRRNGADPHYASPSTRSRSGGPTVNSAAKSDV